MRKYFAATLLLLMSAALALSVQKPDDWIAYTSPEGHYSVLIPAQPTLSTQESTAANGEKFPQYLASVVAAGDIVFMIAYFDTLPGTVFSADAARDGMVKAIKGTLISENAITLGGYSGRDLKVLTTPTPPPPAEGTKPAEPVDYIVRARFYEADKRIYVVQLIFPKSLENGPFAAKATKYFDSFQVVKN
ncbi:MAG: hypothetical protein M3R69_04020 [Acidobacteriota bacterium]|nr:hypothetical protein [Acidobacteriota bacterium]